MVVGERWRGAARGRRVRRGEVAARPGEGVDSRSSVESAGAGAINLAGISELMNVIKIQPPAS